ncbi:hypothetical protein V2A60_002158 [Cordyceps javanica]
MASEIHTLVTNLCIIQIKEFFDNHIDVTRVQCDSWAARALGQTVCASTLQGVSSYTVVASDSTTEPGKVVQFRGPEDAFDLELIRNIRVAYGSRFVPEHESIGTIGGLHAYIMNDIGGISVYLARDRLRAHGSRLLKNTVQDFAR